MIALVTAYLAGGLVLLGGALVFAACVRWHGRHLAGAADGFVRWGWLTLILSLLLPAVLIGGGVAPLRRPALEIWSGPSSPQGLALPDPDRVGVRLTGGPAARAAGYSVGRGDLDLVLLLFGVGVALAGGRLFRAQRRLGRFCAGLPVVKRVGRVVVAAGPDGGSPFAAWVRGRAYVVLPTAALDDPRRVAMILAHEAHHLRQGHLRAARWLAGLQILYFWNPALGLWRRALGELEDLSCDRAVLARWKGAAREYARCLLWAAAHASGQTLAGARPALPTGAPVLWMAAGARGPLARRMKMLSDDGDASDAGDAKMPGRRAGPPIPGPASKAARVALLAGASLAAVMATALAVHAAVGTPQVSADAVAAIGARISARSGFPVIADARIAEALNRRLLQPAWRERTRAGLERMPAYRPTLESSLRQAGLPVELVAMVLSESNFDPQARTGRPPPRQSVGLWQFIPETAKRFGLAVGPDGDDRLDTKKSSDAAAAYLASLYKRFGDWHLAISAYNGGAGTLDIFRAGASVAETRDRLLASEAEFGRYLASVMISMLVIEHPALLD